MLNALLVFVFIALAQPLAHADSLGHDEAREAVKRGDIKPLSEVLVWVEGRYRGRVLDAELERHHDRYIYEIKLIGDDNWLRKIYLDARSLEVLKEKRKPASDANERDERRHR